MKRALAVLGGALVLASSGCGEAGNSEADVTFERPTPVSDVISWAHRYRVELRALERHYPYGDDTWTFGYGVDRDLSDSALIADYRRESVQGPRGYFDLVEGSQTAEQRADLIRADKQARRSPALVDSATVSGSGDRLEAAKSNPIVDSLVRTRFPH